jgi:hypothetical protein
MAIYSADDLSNPAISPPPGGTAVRPFVATCATMLATTGAAGFLVSDIIVLAPIPGGSVLDSYFVSSPAIDTSTGVTIDLGDNQILANAVTGLVSGAQVTPALPATTFTLTCKSSTSSFATAGIVMVGGCMIAHTGKTGSTLTGCTAMVQNLTLPDGALVQEAGNTAGFNAAAVIGRSSAAGYLAPWGNITSTTATAATVVTAAVPANYVATYNTGFNNVASPANPNNITGQQYFLIRIHASPTTDPSYTTQVYTGWIQYHSKGYNA